MRPYKQMTKRNKTIGALLALTLTFTSVTLAQEKGEWRASNSSAKSITGPVAFSGQRMAINFASFPIAQIRSLTPAELTALFAAEDPIPGSGNLYRLIIPAAKTFLHHSPLCGTEETDWVATYTQGHTLQLAFLSGPKMPTFTPEFLTDTPRLCNTFTYVR
jgi:hypothetical protein